MVESRMVVTRDCWEGEMGTMLMGTEFQFCKMKSSADAWLYNVNVLSFVVV